MKCQSIVTLIVKTAPSACFVLLLCSTLEVSAATPALKKPIGIVTQGGVFSEMIPAGKALPSTYSDSFGNAEDNQRAIEITIGQKDASGMEKIVVAIIDNLPQRSKGKLSVIVTVTVDSQKQLRVKATVPETGYIKQFGPFPVQ
jgi:molecular chaperone DnaK (HSP70)